MIRRLNCDPYPGIIYLTNTRVEFLRLRGESLLTATDDLGNATGITWSADDSPLRFVVGVFDARSVPVMVHEFGHVLIRLFSGIGMPINIDTQEAFCYFLDHLVRQGQEFFYDLELEEAYQLKLNPPMTALSGW